MWAQVAMQWHSTANCPKVPYDTATVSQVLLLRGSIAHKSEHLSLTECYCSCALSRAMAYNLDVAVNDEFFVISKFLSGLGLLAGLHPLIERW